MVPYTLQWPNGHCPKLRHRLATKIQANNLPVVISLVENGIRTPELRDPGGEVIAATLEQVAKKLSNGLFH